MSVISIVWLSLAIAVFGGMSLIIWQWNKKL